MPRSSSGWRILVTFEQEGRMKEREASKIASHTIPFPMEYLSGVLVD